MEDEKSYRNTRSPWTVEEYRYVEAGYGKIPTREIAEHLGRTPTAVRLAARSLGLNKQSLEWTDAEKDVMRTHYVEGAGIAKVMEMLPGRTKKTIFTMAQKMGLYSARGWTREETQLLRKHYPLIGTSVAEKLPGRTPEAVKIKANQLGISFKGSMVVSQKMWTPEELALLKQHEQARIAEIQHLFPDRTAVAISHARARLKAKP
ncbi:hypothetical protein CIG19_13820 [Enterobacterales bacterium CwR94]|nr:hypothetical protein CIG19_13820 [Enterobacterales bacterium CwR94]